jgi:hypothetical protein
MSPATSTARVPIIDREHSIVLIFGWLVALIVTLT